MRCFSFVRKLKELNEKKQQFFQHFFRFGKWKFIYLFNQPSSSTSTTTTTTTTTTRSLHLFKDQKFVYLNRETKKILWSLFTNKHAHHTHTNTFPSYLQKFSLMNTWLVHIHIFFSGKLSLKKSFFFFFFIFLLIIFFLKKLWWYHHLYI